MTDERLEYRRTIVTSQACATCGRESHYYLIEVKERLRLHRGSQAAPRLEDCMTPAAGIRYVPFKDGSTLKTLFAGLPWQYKPRMASKMNDGNIPGDWVTNIVLTGEAMSDAACCQIIDSVEYARQVRGAGADVGSFPSWIRWMLGLLAAGILILCGMGVLR